MYVKAFGPRAVHSHSLPTLIRKPPADSSETLLDHAQAHLSEGERVTASFQTDLDASLHFHRGLIALTDQRLLPAEQARGEAMSFRSWKLAEIDDLVLEELGATAAIHLIQGGTQVYEWRATSGCMREADAFLARFQERRQVPNSEGDPSGVHTSEAAAAAPGAEPGPGGWRQAAFLGLPGKDMDKLNKRVSQNI